jgi:aspartokinase-like uncharacterized kinase
VKCSLAVVKIGGSLYDLPDLAWRLSGWLPQAGSDAMLVPGGGPTADVVREFDRVHHLGEEQAHRLALHALQLNAHFLKSLLPTATIIDHPEQAADGLRILNPLAFLNRDERLPPCWAVTSDSIAARAAVVSGAERLILLKSVTIPDGVSWEEAGERGFVDAWFARTLADASPPLQVRAVNFREWSP